MPRIERKWRALLFGGHVQLRPIALHYESGFWYTSPACVKGRIPTNDMTGDTHVRNTIMKAGVAVFASVSLALGATGSVYDEAKVWFRGGYDANGDGIFAASEFVDSSRPKSDTAHQTVTLTGNGIQYNKGAVWSAFNPFYTNTQYYVSLPNGDCATAADCSSITIVNPLGSDESWSNFTIFIRFRWDGKFTPKNATDLEIFNTGWNGGGQRCIMFGFRYFTETDDFAPYWQVGATTTYPDATAGIKLPVGEWQDFIITVTDRGVGANASIDVYRGQNGNAFWVKGRYPWIQAWSSSWGHVARVGLASTDPITLGSAQFSGDIAAWALWPKVLNDDERREALADPRPGDALFRIGKEDGKADEFSAAASAQYEVDANGTWDIVPSALDGTHDTLKIDFEVPPSYDYLNQILRLVAISGDGWIEGTVADNVRGTSVQLRARRCTPGHPADFFVPHDKLRTGPHTLTLKFLRGSGVTFDVIEMQGSFCLGQIDYNKYPNKQFDGNSGQTYYNIVNGYWRAMDGGISDDTLFDSTAANYDPATNTATTVFFNVPEDLVCCSNELYISYNQFKEKPNRVCWYLNNAQFYDSTTHDDGVEYQFEVKAKRFPANSFVPGVNTIKLRRTHAGSWWGGIRGLRIEILDAPPPEPTGTVFVVR